MESPVSEINDLRRLIKIHQRRLQKLKEQKAFSGPATDPAVLMEIEDIQVEIARSKRKLTALEQKSFPLKTLRQAVKQITGPVAIALTGQAWKKLKQYLLTEASKLPTGNYLDATLLHENLGDMAYTTRQLRHALETYRYHPNPSGLEVVQELAPPLASYLLKIFRLAPGEVPELEALAASHQQQKNGASKS